MRHARWSLIPTMLQPLCWAGLPPVASFPTARFTPRRFDGRKRLRSWSALRMCRWPLRSRARSCPVSFRDAMSSSTCSGLSLLLQLLQSEDFSLLKQALSDRLHQPFRQKLVPGLAQALELEHEDLLGVCLSGSGPSIVALAQTNLQAIAELLASVYESHRDRLPATNPDRSPGGQRQNAERFYSPPGMFTKILNARRTSDLGRCAYKQSYPGQSNGSRVGNHSTYLPQHSPDATFEQSARLSDPPARY